MLFSSYFKKKAQQSFELVNKGDYHALLKDCSDNIVHTFAGNHPLGGTRNSLKGLEDWFTRLFILFPNLKFTINDIVVTGTLFHAKIIVEWVDTATPKDGKNYVNEGVHILTITKGKVARIQAFLDSQKVEKVCNRLAKLGIKEAEALPIEY